jgi:PAS domain S-box-containing protein
MHKLLQRQIRRYLSGSAPTPEEWTQFVAAVNEAYEQSEADHVQLERSLELSSQEMIEINENLRTDIGKRQVTERELQSSLSILRATLEATNNGIVVVDLERHIQHWNHRFADMWKIPHEILDSRSAELVLNHVLIQLKDPQGFLTRINELQARAEEESCDILEFKDGRIFERRSKPQRMGGHCVGRVWSFHDLTEQKQMERRTLISEKMVAVGQLAAGVAHEINNPLGVIMGFAQGVCRRLQPGDPLELPLKSIEREAIRCKNLTQDLLVFSRLGSEEKTPLNLNEAIKASLSLIRAQTKVGRSTITTEFAENLPPIQANQNQMQQVIINLANNALDAMPQGGELTIRTEVLKERSLSWACIKVSDTGQGIPPDVLPRIFEPFFTTKPIGKGTGLGLSLIFEIVTKHAGFIDVQSQPGKTEFTVKFPALANVSADLPTAGPPAAPRSSR